MLTSLTSLGENLRKARKKKFPQDDMRAFSIRIGVSRATLQKMEQGDLSVSLNKYYVAAKLLGCDSQFEKLFEVKGSIFDDE